MIGKARLLIIFETKKIFLLVFGSLKMPFHRKISRFIQIKPVWDGFSEYMLQTTIKGTLFFFILTDCTRQEFQVSKLFLE